MADDQKDQRTEEATPRRLQEARRRGQTFKSQELNWAVIFLVSFVVLLLMGAKLYRDFYSLSRSVFLNLSASNLELNSVQGLLNFYFIWSFKILLPFLIAGVLTAVVLNVVQVGFNFTTEPLKPSFERINFFAGLTRIFSRRNLVELFKNFFKFTLLAFVFYWRLKSSVPLFFQKIGEAPQDYFNNYFTLLKKLALDTLWVLIIIGAFDYWYQRREYFKSLRMTKQEVKEEYKQTEGDPLIKARIRERQRQIALNQIAREVPNATVVVTNPIHLAVALKYERGKMRAPKIVAKGAGFLAEKIKEIARANQVEVVENVEVARFLYKNCEVGDEIPEELYNAVAEIIALVYRKRRKR